MLIVRALATPAVFQTRQRGREFQKSAHQNENCGSFSPLTCASGRRVLQMPTVTPPSPHPVRRREAPWTSRDSVLAEWRRVHLAPLEKAAELPGKPVGAYLPGLIEKLGLPQRRSEAEVLKAWNRLIDPTVTAHAQPRGLRKGTLFINVDSSVWLSEIVRYRRREILERLQHCFGPRARRAALVQVRLTRLCRAFPDRNQQRSETVR